MRRVNEELRVPLAPKALLANKVNAVCKVSWAHLDLLANRLNEVILDPLDLLVKLVLVV